MRRRPFLKKISLFSAATALIPFSTFGKQIKMNQTGVKFIVASDGHYGQPETDYEETHKQLIAAIHKEEGVDFVVFNGDLIHDEPSLMPKVKKVYDTLQVPYYPVKGNHDRISEEDWESIWGIPADHSFTYQDSIGFVLANSSNIKGEYRCADTDWIRQQLDSHGNLSHVFIFIHISQQDWTKHGVACEEVLNLIGRYDNVRAVFHGHDHDVDGIMYNRKKPYLWSGHFGGSWGSPFPGYRVCEVGEDGKVITYLKAMKDGRILSSHSL